VPPPLTWVFLWQENWRDDSVERIEFPTAQSSDELRMARGTDITSFSDFRAHLRAHLDRRKATRRPLFVTRKGKTEAVVLSPTAFAQLMDQAELAKSLALLDRSMKDVGAGRVQPFRQAIREIAKGLGLKLGR